MRSSFSDALRGWTRFGFLLVGLLIAQVAFSQGGPPLITDDPGTPGSGNWEINVAFTDSHYPFGVIYEAPHLDLNYGYGKNLQLKLEGPFTIFSSSSTNYAALGYTDWGVKWRFQEETKQLPAISTYPQILFVGNRGFAQVGVTDPGTDFLLPVEASKTYGQFVVDAEFGLLFRQFTGTQLDTGICAEFDVSKRLALLGEIHDLVGANLVQDQLVFNLGFKYDFTAQQSLICSAGRGFGFNGDDNPSFLTYIGVQFRTGHSDSSDSSDDSSKK